MRFVFLLFVLVSPALATVVSNCPSGFCQTNDDPACSNGSPECVCVASQKGTPCIECGGRGYIAGGTCQCNLPDMNPIFDCTVTLSTAETLSVQRVSANVTCDYFFDEQTGWYTRAQYFDTFGNPEYISLPQCYQEAIGPKPDGVPDETPALGELVACRRFGGPDPNSTKSDWVECSGHGAWSTSKRRCECDATWNLKQTFQPNPQVSTPTGTGDIVTCASCAPFYGPPPGTPDAQACSAVFTPDPLDGIEKTCGGHGAWTGTGCACFNSTETGFWRLGDVSREFQTIQYVAPTYAFADYVASVFTVASCVVSYT